MIENTIDTDIHPDMESIEKLCDAIMTVCDQRRALEKRRNAMGKELAILLCPFSLNQSVRIPSPRHAKGYIEGKIRDIWFDRDYGYQLYLEYENGEQHSLSCFQNADVELCNSTIPVLSHNQMRHLLKPFQDIINGYF